MNIIERMLETKEQREERLYHLSPNGIKNKVLSEMKFFPDDGDIL